MSQIFEESGAGESSEAEGGDEITDSDTSGASKDQLASSCGSCDPVGGAGSATAVAMPRDLPNSMRECTLSMRICDSKGFEMKSSAPLSLAFSTLNGSKAPVRSRIGMCRSAWSCRIFSHTSYPLAPGISVSTSITSGTISAAFSSAPVPLLTMASSYSSLLNMMLTTFWMVILSSARSSLKLIVLPPQGGTGICRSSGTPQCADIGAVIFRWKLAQRPGGVKLFTAARMPPKTARTRDRQARLPVGRGQKFQLKLMKHSCAAD